jgi:hypothetical protein
LPALEQALQMQVYDRPFVLDLRELGLMDCDFQCGRVGPRMMRR